MAGPEPSPSVAIGRYELRVAAPGGTLIDPSDEEVDPRPLADALKAGEPPRGPPSPDDDPIAEAEEVTRRAEEAAELAAAIAAGTVFEPEFLTKRIDLMLEVLERQDANGRHAETLRLARAINRLFALAKRWIALVRTLRIALRAAKQAVGKDAEHAWAQHELGTLHLAADDPAGAEQRLGEARELWRRARDAAGLAATEHNLGVLCGQLRQMLRDGRLESRRGRSRRLLALAVAAAVLLFGAGAVAAAVVGGGDQQLTVDVGGRGTVTSAPAGILCPGVCSTELAKGRQVTLTASARPGWRFAGWGGDCAGRDPCAVVLDSDRAASARFVRAPESRTLRVQPAGGGSGRVTSRPSGIDCGKACRSSFARGSQVTLTARPTGGSTFAGWSGGGCSGTGECVVRLDDRVTVTARFEPQSSETVELRLEPRGRGSGTVTSAPAGISCPPDCSETLPAGRSVLLTEAPNARSVFAGWSGARCSGIQPTCRVTLADAVTTVTATYDRKPTTPTFTLTVRPGGTGSGTVTSTPEGIACGLDCAGTFSANDTVVLSETASADSTFTGWGGACSGTGATCTVTVTDFMTATATFAAQGSPEPVP